MIEQQSRVSPRRSVFGSGRSRSGNPAARDGMGGSGTVPIGTFRQTMRERDAALPREVVTGLLLGDPAPGRTQPVVPPITGSGVPINPAKIHLTFREMHEAYGDAE